MSNSNRNLGDLDKSAFKVDPNDPTNVSRKICDEEGNALLQDILTALQNGGGGTGGGTSGVTCQKHVLNLVANVWTEIPHSYNNDVCDFKAFDSNGCHIEIGFRYDPVTLKLEACVPVNLDNVLIVLEGEL